ncbi:hypothetical protein Saso_76380 [Streptomyces asoensis]|uniref:Uncharacterized protein n=1 Tax=Streptomyces asoensis TaxID=249586 RepID=A0ABQ3SCX4_9ACTN|nr:hypothetical protein GCM10010496_65610 [Streptomyces asoensis]GHI65988.1 hypothetical protein Saso_76380 [Streptomyces asoensis]
MPGGRPVVRRGRGGDPAGGGRVACGFGPEPAFHSSAHSAVRPGIRAAELCRDALPAVTPVRGRFRICHSPTVPGAARILSVGGAEDKEPTVSVGGRLGG